MLREVAPDDGSRGHADAVGDADVPEEPRAVSLGGALAHGGAGGHDGVLEERREAGDVDEGHGVRHARERVGGGAGAVGEEEDELGAVDVHQRARHEAAEELHDADDRLDVAVLLHVGSEGGGQVREHGHLEKPGHRRESPSGSAAVSFCLGVSSWSQLALPRVMQAPLRGRTWAM